MAGGPGFEPGPGDPESPRLPLAEIPQRQFVLYHIVQVFASGLRTWNLRLRILVYQ